ncbi:unnamed protein product [Thelazia callipaeda]|uniref:GOLGA2L5 domain-containing protein n=1 Tax=Thelazia callipaeda TaxID=103827 RepID=A0A0N5CNP8_THECL|nr:unnamed protein product [Thelazia callipaeda]
MREKLFIETKEKEQLASQLAELIGHYTQIHTAYTKLSEFTKNDVEESALRTQLIHLQTAMSVVVKEKTALLQQIREKSELLYKQNEQIRNLTTEMCQKNSQISSLETDIQLLHEETNALSLAIQKQTEQAENNQKEAVNWQNEILRLQQDRDDAKERLKVCMKESEAALAELDRARKLLHMKDIYLRQIGAYTGVTASVENGVDNLVGRLHYIFKVDFFHYEVEHLRSALKKSSEEAERWKKETQLAREHYESYGAQLNQKIVLVSSKLEEVSNVKMALESKVQALENQVELLETMAKKTILNIDENSSCGVRFEKSHSLKDDDTENRQNKGMESLQKAELVIEELKEKLTNKEQEVHALSSELTKVVSLTKKSELMKNEHELIATKDSLAKTHLFIDEQQKHAEGVLLLSEQLQNEKATVSRAIAQNRELKEQLVELQDKLVTVTQESMERESGRLSALHLVDQLKNELNSREAQPPCVENNCHNQFSDLREPDELRFYNFQTVSTPSASECYDRDVSLSHTEDTQARTEVELANVKMILDDLRLEHRRVAQENSELRRLIMIVYFEYCCAVRCFMSLDGLSFFGNIFSLVFLALSIEEKPLAWTELEARFTRAMLQIADLAEEKERLQHIVMQLETENDTIGVQMTRDYVTLYQHQRRKINERIREREEAVAKLSFEKAQVQQKLNELQETLVNLLSKKGLLHPYDYNKELGGSRSIHLKQSQKIKSNRHNTANSSPNNEKIIGNAKMIVPNSPDSCIESINDFETEKLNDGIFEHEIKEYISDNDDGVQGILNLISELQDLERSRILPPRSPNLHCSECRGKLINL